jgi:Ni/Fe-hydrogenase subunit HybB-like protein
MVLILGIPLRRAFHLEHVITKRHLDNAAKLLLATGMIVVYGYFIEIFMAWYSGVEFETFMAENRMFGYYGWAFWLLILCNFVAIQPLWFRRVRQSPLALFLISIVVSVGMWLERFVIIVVSLTRDFLPSSWGNYYPTFWDWALYIGSFGLFFTLFFLFIRLLPSVATAEMKELVHHDAHHGSDPYETIRSRYYREEGR